MSGSITVIQCWIFTIYVMSAQDCDYGKTIARRWLQPELRRRVKVTIEAGFGGRDESLNHEAGGRRNPDYFIKRSNE